MKIQPGSGYTFDSSSKGFTFDTTDPFPNQYVPTALVQFKPSNWGETGGTSYFTMTPGTINGVVPCMGTATLANLITLPNTKAQYDWSSAVGDYQLSYIYLQASPAPGSSGLTWPCADISEAGYPTIKAYPTTKTDTDGIGYLLLAQAQKNVISDAISFNQFVTTSIWSERHKYSQPNSAYYYYYRL
jgi:hypothetical protein